MTNATLADGSATEATAVHAAYTIRVEDALARLVEMKGNIEALQATYATEEAKLIELLEADFDGAKKIRYANGIQVNFHVVRAMRNVIDTPKALKVLVRRRLYKQLVEPSIKHEKFMSLVNSGAFGDLAECVERKPNKPFIKIS